MKIIGMDISKGIATCVMLEEVPKDIESFIHSKDFTFWHIEPNANDLGAIATLQPDAILFEASGGRYERAFSDFFRAKGIAFRQVSGRRMSLDRQQMRLEKNDHFDALAIAMYGLKYWGDPKAFIPDIEPDMDWLRQQWLRRHSLNKLRSAHLTRIRGQFAYEFPEQMEFSYERDWGQGTHGVVAWLAGRAPKTTQSYWDNLHNGALRRLKAPTPGAPRPRVQCPGTFGRGVSDYTKWIAVQMADIEDAMAAIEIDIDKLLSQEKYRPYMEAFDKLGLSQFVRSIWITRIYPFERFMGEDGLPIRVRRPSRTSGKICTHDRSLSQFKAALGAAQSTPRSGTDGGIAPTVSKRWQSKKREGKEDKIQPIGCKYSRIAFWNYAVVQIETGRAKAPLSAQLKAHRDKLKDKGRNMYQRAGNLHGYACKLLYKELVKMVSPP